MQKEISFFVPMAQNDKIFIELQKSMSSVQGVSKVNINQKQKKCSVKYDNHTCEEESIRESLNDIGINYYFICRKEVDETAQF